MYKLTAIIVDDEKASRLTLFNYLTKYCPIVEVKAEAENINQAFDFIQKHRPNVVFLDVEMPYGNAFDLLEKVTNPDFDVVFITAFSNYALEALNLSASNYLLKPLDINQLIKAVEKVQEHQKIKEKIKSSSILLENLNIENKQLKKVVLPMLEGFEVVVLKDIIRCEANDNLCDFYLSDGSKRTVCRTLKFYDEVLKDFDFIRIHKSHLINLNFVKQYRKSNGGEVVLSNSKIIPISPNRKNEFLERFS